jgi:hypothetical protein
VSPDELSQQEQPLTIDDLRHRAEQVRDLAITETKRTVNTVTSQPATRIAVVAVVGIAVALSVAYYIGKRSGPAR